MRLACLVIPTLSFSFTESHRLLQVLTCSAHGKQWKLFVVGLTVLVQWLQPQQLLYIEVVQTCLGVTFLGAEVGALCLEGLLAFNWPEAVVTYL